MVFGAMILYKVLLRDLNDLNPGGGRKLSKGNTGRPLCIYISVARFDGVVPLPLHCADIFVIGTSVGWNRSALCSGQDAHVIC